MAGLKIVTVLITVLLGWYGHGPGNDANSLKVKLINSDRQEIGEATLTETPQGVLIRLNLPQQRSGIPPGPHAFHIHQVGKCEPPFKSAGEHFNPLGKKHGARTEIMLATCPIFMWLTAVL
jgi:Cu/Zn superoxide dismutase